MLFSDANLFPQAAVMLHDGEELSDRKKSELKAIYLEALIRFLDIYANDEIGGNVEIDITKIAHILYLIVIAVSAVFTIFYLIKYFKQKKAQE